MRIPVILYAVAVVVLLAVMPVWRWVGEGLPKPESFALMTEDFVAKLDAQEVAYAAGADKDGKTVVAPPPGDVYLGAVAFEFVPALRLQAGQTYRLHVASLDLLHGFYFPLAEADILLEPGRTYVFEITPDKAGAYAMQCSENCGLGHNKMLGRVQVVGP